MRFSLGGVLAVAAATGLALALASPAAAQTLICVHANQPDASGNVTVWMTEPVNGIDENTLVSRAAPHFRRLHGAGPQETPRCRSGYRQYSVGQTEPNGYRGITTYQRAALPANWWQADSERQRVSRPTTSGNAIVVGPSETPEQRAWREQNERDQMRLATQDTQYRQQQQAFNEQRQTELRAMAAEARALAARVRAREAQCAPNPRACLPARGSRVTSQ